MTFRTLTAEELSKVADFFVVDVETADPEKGATKKELLAALAAGDEPVTWDQYQEIYLVAQERAKVEPAPDAPDLTAVAPDEAPVEEVDKSDWVLIKMERQNHRYDIRGYSFTKNHPFALVAPADASYLVRQQEGFRPAMPEEVNDYYN